MIDSLIRLIIKEKVVIIIIKNEKGDISINSVDI